MNVEPRLKEIIGEPAGRLHTAGSRNDQVARSISGCGSKSACQVRQEQIAALQKALAWSGRTACRFCHAGVHPPADGAAGDLRPPHAGVCRNAGAGPRTRFGDAVERMNFSPLARRRWRGRAFPIDRHMTAKALGFDGPMANSLDAVSARDFALEALARRGDLRAASSRLRRRDRDLVVGAVRVRAAGAMRGRRDPRSCRRSAIRMRRSWCGQGRRGHRALGRHW